MLVTCWTLITDVTPIGLLTTDLTKDALTSVKTSWPVQRSKATARHHPLPSLPRDGRRPVVVLHTRVLQETAQLT